MTKKEVKFWVAIATLNMILFLPWYLFSYTESQFVPYEGLLEGGLYDRFKTLFIRYNYDIFRISTDLFLIFLLLYLFRFLKWFKYIIHLAVVYYVIILIYQVYSSFFKIMYQMPPIIYNDLPFIENGAKIVLGSINWLTVLSIAIFILVIYVIAKLFQKSASSLSTMRFGNYSKSIVGFLLLIILISTIRYGSRSVPIFGVQFIGNSVRSNLRGSFALKRMVNGVDYKEFSRQNKQYQFTLDKNKPNIIILFIESYGRLLLDHPELSDEYQEIMLEKRELMAGKNYHTISALSTAPVSGGGSWLSYTTFGMGYKLNSQSLFFNFLKNEKFHDYLHLYKWLHGQGYKNYRLNSLVSNGNFSIPWDQYTSFFSVDQWIRFDDLNYKGILYGFGPAPPDQYSLNYALKLIRGRQSEPFSLFFISKNSHTPFILPHKTMKDWNRWNEIRGQNQPSRFFQKPTLDNYKKSINYQLDYIFQIIQGSNENDLFIVIGDHQPPALETEGFETPVHIISKDSTLINGFENYGFTPGLLPDKNKIPLKHAGLYTMLLRELKRNYSNDSTSLPDYLPNGIIFGNYQDTK